MTSLTIDVFWQRLATSGLVDPERVGQLGRDFSADHANSPPASLGELISWLISRQVLTAEQCTALLDHVATSPGTSVPHTSTSSPPVPPPPPGVAEGSPVRPSATSPAPVSSPPSTSAPPMTSEPPDATPSFSIRYQEKKSGSKNLLGVATFSLGVLIAAAIVVTVVLWKKPPANEGHDQASGDANIVASREPSAELTATNEPPVPAVDENTPTAAAPASENDAGAADSSTPREKSIADDGETLWGSPTSGTAPTLQHVPEGTQLIFMLRPRELFSSKEGRSLLAGMGPAGDTFAKWVTAATDLELDEIERLDLMLGESVGQSPLLAVVAYPTETANPITRNKAWTDARQLALDEASLVNDRFGYDVSADDHFLIAPTNVLNELKAMGPQGAPLSPPLTQLLEAADADRHCNIAFTASYLRGARESLYGDNLAPLREGVDWMLGSGHDLQAGLLSLHLEEQMFSELRLFGVRDVLPQILARQFHTRIDQTPRRVKDHLKTLSIHSYSRDILWDFPEMLQSVVHYTRHDRDGRQGVLRCYLPAGAAGHLASAIELTLWETTRAGAGDSQPAATTEAPKEQTLDDRLAQTTSLSFDRSSLEKALQTLSEETGIRIVVLGRDLQLDGITKNQSFGIDLKNRPVREILNTIVQLANPDKTAKNLTDSQQKLIYVLKTNYEGGPDAVIITTRAQAAARQDRLPSDFASP